MRSHGTFLFCVNRTITLVVIAVSLAAFAQAEKVIYRFAGGTDGFGPDGPVVIDKAGNLYGTTSSGGANNTYGTVFTLTRSGGSWMETVLYSFTGASDGANPYAGLIFDEAGNLYGTADGGGDFGCGTVFELTPSLGGWSEQTIYSFFGEGQGDGCNPFGGLTIDSSGNLFGTTQNGGVDNEGIVFELTPSAGGWTETVLWALTGGIDGGIPRAGVVFDSVGNIYLTASGAGFFGGGTVLRLAPVSGGGWTGASIFSFTGGNNGCHPLGGVVFDSVGNLYGTTQLCGADQVGTVFKLTPTVGQWKMSLIHTFTGASDGAEPLTGVVFDNAGNLWGTTFYGGLFGNGTVFRLTQPSGKGRWKEAEYSFKGGSDGASPSAGVALGSSSVGPIAFGTTTAGGMNGLGVVYQISLK
jgi:uncharacterized repeat protein (TIGR03803 family)